MWKVFAIFCVLLPGGDCEKKYEFPEAFYNTQEECMVRAEYKAEEMINYINNTGDAISFQIGCEYQGEIEQQNNEQLNNYNRKRQRSLDRPI